MLWGHITPQYFRSFTCSLQGFDVLVKWDIENIDSAILPELLINSFRIGLN